MIKYGKSYGDIAEIKANYVSENNEMVAYKDRCAKVYSEQPKRGGVNYVVLFLMKKSHFSVMVSDILFV